MKPLGVILLIGISSSLSIAATTKNCAESIIEQALGKELAAEPLAQRMVDGWSLFAVDHINVVDSGYDPPFNSMQRINFEPELASMAQDWLVAFEQLRASQNPKLLYMKTLEATFLTLMTLADIRASYNIESSEINPLNYNRPQPLVKFLRRVIYLTKENQASPQDLRVLQVWVDNYVVKFPYVLVNAKAVTSASETEMSFFEKAIETRMGAL